MSIHVFLTHCQLHEELFSFLPTENILNIRCVAAEYDALVVNFTKSQVQDVLGQDLPTLSDLKNFVVRTIDAHLLRLLVVLGEDIGQVLLESPESVSVRSITRELIRGASAQTVRKAMPTICNAMTTLFQRVAEDEIGDEQKQLVIAKCGELRLLSLPYMSAAISRSCLLSLVSNSHALESLNVEFRGMDLEDVMKAVSANCHRLQSLNVAQTNIKLESIELVGSGCHQLRSLNVSSTRLITDEFSKVVAHCWPHLESLNVSFTEGRVTDETIKVIAASCPKLQLLKVAHTTKITDTSIQLVAASCRQLRELDVRNTIGNISDVSIKLEAENCVELQSLDVSQTKGFATDESINLVAINCPQLRSLDVRFTELKVTDKSMTLIAKNCQLLISLNGEYLRDRRRFHKADRSQLPSPERAAR